jgi:hypothetical protein
MNTRTHLTLVPATDGGAPSHRATRRRSGSSRPAGGRAAGLTALAAGLTLGLAVGAAATLATHPGDYAMVLLPLAGAAGITLAAAFRSRAVAQKRLRARRISEQRRQHRRQAMLPRPVLVHSRDEFRPVLIAGGSVAAPTRRAA